METFPAQAPHGAALLIELPTNDLLAEGSVRTTFVPSEAHLKGHVEHNGNREHVMCLREGHELASRFNLHVRCVHYGQAARGEPLACDVVQDVERVVRREPGRSSHR